MLTELKEKPILFSTPMVKAILEGRKTQTRRVIKPQPVMESYHLAGYEFAINGRNYKSPYQVGQRLWVRETFYVPSPNHNPVYKATTGEFGHTWEWKPSIFMPRWASRITLEVTGVRVQRLQEITEDDAEAEGIPFKCGYYCDPKVGHVDHYEQVIEFSKLWDSINSKRGYSWESNPWVWAILFKNISKDAQQ